MSQSVVSQSAVSSDQINGVQDIVCPVIDSVEKNKVAKVYAGLSLIPKSKTLI